MFQIINPMLSNPGKIKSHIVELIKDSKNRLTPLAVEKQLLYKNPELSKKILNHSLKELVAEGDLTYTYEFGTSFLEASFDKPVRVSDHVVIKPERCTFFPHQDDVVVTLQKGASFGSGRHPTTRLAIRGMEAVLLKNSATEKKRNPKALDVGTGSGILAIASVLMGMKKAIGLDTDPCARSEALQNIRANNLEDKVVIDPRPFESINETFYLVLANLRFPTLMGMCDHISKIVKNGGVIVVSGLKDTEIDSTKQAYERSAMKMVNRFEEKGWASLVFQKTAE